MAVTSDMGIPKRRASVHWRKDRTILERLKKVEEQHLDGVSNVQIAAELLVDEKTVRNDLKRIYILWAEYYASDIDKRKQRSIAVLRRVQKKAYKEFELCSARDLNKPKFLSEVRMAEDSVVKVLGLAVEKHEVTGEIGIRRYIGVDPTEV